MMVSSKGSLLGYFKFQSVQQTRYKDYGTYCLTFLFSEMYFTILFIYMHIKFDIKRHHDFDFLSDN